VNEFWLFGKPMEPGINVPFWSLSYEAVYYGLAGFIFFTSGCARVVLCIVLLACAGPTIGALWGGWLIGFFLYHLRHKISGSEISGLFLALLGFGLLLLSPRLRQYQFALPFIDRKNLIADYYDGLAFGLHLVGVHIVQGRVGAILSPIDRIVRWLGSITFALYLFHRPIIQLLAVVHVGTPDSWAQRIYLIGFTFLIVVTVGGWCERQKLPLRAALVRLSSRERPNQPGGWGWRGRQA